MGNGVYLSVRENTSCLKLLNGFKLNLVWKSKAELNFGSYGLNTNPTVHVYVAQIKIYRFSRKQLTVQQIYTWPKIELTLRTFNNMEENILSYNFVSCVFWVRSNGFISAMK